MEARLECHELAAARVALGEAHGAFVGLGAGVAEEGLLQLAGGDLGELLRQGADGGHVIDVAAGVDDLVGLGLGGLQDGRVVVAGVGHRDAGETVDVLFAVDVVEPGALAVVDHDRLDALDEAGHDVVAVLVLDTHGIDHPSSDVACRSGLSWWVCARFYQSRQTVRPRTAGRTHPSTAAALAKLSGRMRLRQPTRRGHRWTTTCPA